MAFSYNSPGNSPRDEVRFLIGDTIAKKHYLEDEEISFVLERNGGNAALSAIRACEAIIARLSRARDETVGSVSVALSQAYDNYTKTLMMLRGQYNDEGGITPYAGGISLSDKAINRSDRDWNRPDFATDMLQGWAGPFASAGNAFGRIDRGY